ncbi:MAG TPA: T6SS immunity protein Tdi1 domain-containing protein [Mucilaginibacter sp.]|nr:T6SS immunity protein Tdi1 domain-containing protein [Mucilaginibacter sp.]
MNLNNFSSVFKSTGTNNNYAEKYRNDGLEVLQRLSELNAFFEQFGGRVFDNGLYKVHNQGSFYLWTDLTFDCFKKYKGNSYCFAFDWVGRQFAINYLNKTPRILLLDPATFEAFELESDIQTFHSEQLKDFKDGQLEFSKFKKFMSDSPDNLSFEKCAGFKLPLFLGGKDEIANLEVIDMEVYWGLSYQMYMKTRGLPPGTKVDFSF